MKYLEGKIIYWKFYEESEYTKSYVKKVVETNSDQIILELTNSKLDTDISNIVSTNRIVILTPKEDDEQNN